MLTGAYPGWRLQLASCYEGKNVRATPDQWVRVRVRAGTLGGEWRQVRRSRAYSNGVALAVPYRAPTTLCPHQRPQLPPRVLLGKSGLKGIDGDGVFLCRQTMSVIGGAHLARQGRECSVSRLCYNRLCEPLTSTAN